MQLLRPKATAQGQRIRIEVPSFFKRISAWLFDFGIFLPLFFEMFRIVYKVQNLTLAVLSGFGIVFLIRTVVLVIFKDTLGSRIFYYRDAFRGGLRRLGILLLLGFSLSLSTLISKSIPAFMLSSERILTAQQTNLVNTDSSQVLPFYFTMGIWPKTFEGKRYFFTLPYEKGPPKHYLGRIILALALPDIKVEIEGPKTPEKRSAKEWKECFDATILGTTCRGFLLRRHWNDIEKNYGQIWNWNIQWFKVSGNGPEELQPQGVWIEAKTGDKTIHRVVLISSSGTHQSISLYTNNTDLGKKALGWFTGIIQSLQVYDNIQSVRVASEKRLTQINLTPLKSKEQNAIPIESVLDAQAALLSQISVRPADFDAYFHLGGTSILMIRYFSDPKNTLQNHSFRGTPPLILLREVIENAYRYTKDIAPTDARVHELSSLLAEARRF